MAYTRKVNVHVAARAIHGAKTVQLQFARPVPAQKKKKTQPQNNSKNDATTNNKAASINHNDWRNK